MNMLSAQDQRDDVNVLASQTDWSWLQTLGRVFRPRGVNLMVAQTAIEFVKLVHCQQVHATIVDADTSLGGLTTVKILRKDFPKLPCLVVSKDTGHGLLKQALDLDVFSVIEKPVNMVLLQQQLNRLFMKVYRNSVFEEHEGLDCF